MELSIRTTPYETASGGAAEDGEPEPVGFWQETADVTPTDPLTGDRSFDVAVVGGGFTGLSTAHELKSGAPDLDVAVLERDFAGFGASGRNGGFVMPLLGWDLQHLVDEVGREDARHAYDLMYTAIDHVRDLVDGNDLDCDKEEVGFMLLNTSRKRERHTREECRLAREMGFEREWVAGGELDGYVDSDAFLSGCYDPEPFVVDPLKLARERMTLAAEEGVEIYERTPVTSLESHGRGVDIGTPRGSVSADAAVLAVNGYGEALEFRRDRFMPVHTYITLTEPVPELLDRVNWGDRRTSFETARNFIHYFRVTEDDRILFGGDDIQLYYGGRFRDRNPGIERDLQRRIREFFPELRDVEFTHSWGGVLSVTMDMLPEFGTADDAGRVHHAAGYSGHGVALANYAGKILAPRVADAVDVDVGFDAEDPFFVDRKPPYIPPDPLRYVGLQLYRRWLDAQDRWQGA